MKIKIGNDVELYAMKQKDKKMWEFQRPNELCNLSDREFEESRVIATSLADLVMNV